MKKICVVTGSRAEYGLLTPLLKALDADELFNLQLVVTGSHLSEHYGNTVKQIYNDGFLPIAELPILNENDGSSFSTAVAASKATLGMAEIIQKNVPDLLIVLGDRYEILAIAQAALLMKLPIAHIHGGEVTEGAMDDAIRHALTKMSSLHFVAAESYRQRVIQMGEPSERVFNVGAPGLEMIQQIKLFSKGELAEQLCIDLQPQIFLVTFHPVTWNTDLKGGLEQLCKALEAYPDATIIWTAPNADAQGKQIFADIQIWADRFENVHLFSSLGSVRYLSMLKCADVVIGNSSSGIIEAPFLGTPTVNIGSRQQGRLMAKTILHAEETVESISHAIGQALSIEAEYCIGQSVYGNGETSKLIVSELKRLSWSSLIYQPFIDLRCTD